MTIEKLINKLVSTHKLNSNIGELILTETSKPMLIIPQLVDSYIHGFLLDSTMAKTTISGDYSPVPAYYLPEIKTGVLEINGAMTARDTEVPCMKSPASYESIKASMSSLIDSGAGIIVARFNSGGGVASQMFDLSRWIAEQRDVVNLIAVIDDHAYSAAYGLASAFESIYATDTSGAGSIGVVLRLE